MYHPSLGYFGQIFGIQRATPFITFSEWWAGGPHPITECGPPAHTLSSLSLSEAGEAHTQGEGASSV